MITVLLAAWNGSAYIEEQLDSILGQTGLVSYQDAGKDMAPVIRVLVSDDGSTDGTREILGRYQKQYPEQVILCHRPDERRAKDLADGIPAAAGNFFWLLECAAGKFAETEKEICSRHESKNDSVDGERQYYMLSDQDDVWKPNKAECLLARMKELEVVHGANHPILVHSDMEVVDANLKVIHPSFFQYQKCSPERVQFSELLAENSVTGGAVMMNWALVELMQERPAACLMHDWWIALAAACFGTISCVKEPLYLYRQHGRNTLGAKETGSAADLKARLGREELVKENYRKMEAQAHAFGKMYGDKMSEEQKAVLRAYLALRYQSPMGRFKNIVKNRFFKSSRIQTLAQCVTIPRPNGENMP